jgi:HD domain-containing protein
MDDLSRAQESLGRALGRARVSEDRELANQVREMGERLAHLLSGLLRMSHLHSSDNRAFDQPVSDVHGALVKLNELLGAVHVVAVEDQVYVNDIRIRAGDKAGSVRELCHELHRHNVGGITFHGPLEGPAIRALVAALGGPAAPSEPRNSLARTLLAQGIEAVELQGRFRFRMAGEATRKTAEPGEIVPRVLAAAEEAAGNLAAGRVPNPLPLRRLVSELLRGDLGAEALWVVPPGAPAWPFHAFRVCHLSLLIGAALGLPESALQDLGVAALYHDAGYASPEARAAGGGVVSLEAHGLSGARLMLRQKGFHEAKVRRVLALLHHHADANHGTPRPGLFARILRIAEDYDSLARRAGTHSPTMALSFMARRAGDRYDPALFQLFLNTMGAYPPGTMLLAEDGRVLRSVSLVRGPDTFAAPLARCVLLPGGAPAPADAPLVDLKDAGRLQALRPAAPRDVA